MNYQETAKILALIKLAYPNSYNKLTDRELDQTVKLWESQFKDYKADIVLAAVNTFISEDLSGFCPNIAQIKNIAYKLLNGEQKTDDEIWLPIKKALRNSTYGANEEYEKLPEDIKQCVTPHQLRDWAMSSENDMPFVRNEVIKEYRSKETRRKEQALLPTKARNLIESKNED